MNSQIALLNITFGMLVCLVWHPLLASPSLWRKRKNLSEEQRARLYFTRALAIIAVLGLAHMLSVVTLGWSSAHELLSAKSYTLLITAAGIYSCIVGSWMLLIQRKRETPEYDGRSFIAIGLFILVTNFLIS